MKRAGLFCLVFVFLCASVGAEERLSFQTGKPWAAYTNLEADAVFCYGINEQLPQRIASWREHGFVPYVMTGVAWGGYQDYLYGKFDGRNHEDEAQMDAAGNRVSHGGDVYYMSPGPSYGKFLTGGIKRAIDAGARAIALEEPEFWVRSGYEESFKREWQAFYHEPWIAPDSSADAQYRASKLKYFLYRRTISDIFSFVRQYSKQIHRDVKCYVATHSMLNYSHWRIVSPESSLNSIDGDGYIAQVWTGTARVPVFCDGVRKERTFESAFLEYQQMQNLARGSGREMWYLTDPVADRGQQPWADYRYNWECTLVASLMQSETWRYEVMPWPERVFHSEYGSIEGKEGYHPIPDDYAAELQAVMRVLGDMKQKDWEWEVGGTRGVGVLVSDTMMFQRAGPGASDGDLGSFYGFAMPLVNHGVPVVPVQMENAGARADYLSPYHVLLLTYEGQKPPTMQVNQAIARWVNNGGALVVVDDDRDAFNGVHEWWNSDGRKYANPREHLFMLLKVPLREEGMHRVGKGRVFYVAKSPAGISREAGGSKTILQLCQSASEAMGMKWNEAGAMAMRRGPYVIAAGLEESGSKQAVHLKGKFVSLLDGGFPIIDDPAIESTKRYVFVDVDRYAAEHQSAVFAASTRVSDEEASSSGVRFKCQGIESTPARLLIRTTGSVKSITVGSKELTAKQWRQDGEWLRAEFPNSSSPVEVKIWVDGAR